MTDNTAQTGAVYFGFCYAAERNVGLFRNCSFRSNYLVSMPSARKGALGPVVLTTGSQPNVLTFRSVPGRGKE